MLRSAVKRMFLSFPANPHCWNLKSITQLQEGTLVRSARTGCSWRHTHLLPARHSPLLLQTLPEQLQQVVCSGLQLLSLRLLIHLHRQNLQQERREAPATTRVPVSGSGSTETMKTWAVLSLPARPKYRLSLRSYLMSMAPSHCKSLMSRSRFTKWDGEIQLSHWLLPVLLTG